MPRLGGNPSALPNKVCIAFLLVNWLPRTSTSSTAPHRQLLDHLNVDARTATWIHSRPKEVSARYQIYSGDLQHLITLVELLNLHNAFHQGQYQTVIDFDKSSLSAENIVPASVLQLRAQVASGQAELVLANVGKQSSAPDFVAVKAFAQYSLGNSAAAIRTIEKLADSESENATVQVLGGTVLQAAGKTDEALALLAKHQGSLEA